MSEPDNTAEPTYPDSGHPDLLELSRVKPCVLRTCTEVVSPMEDYTVRGIPGFCRSCYERLTDA